MATAEFSVIHGDISPVPLVPTGHVPGRPLHRIQEVRRLQEMSLRTAARQLGSDVRSVRAQEQASSDLRLSDLYRWQAALEVPISELLIESDDSLSQNVSQRAQLIRVMKTAASILDTADSPSIRCMAQNLVEQLSDLMPELKEVSSWHSVGQRRSADEVGRIGERPISTETYCSGIDFE